MYVSTSTVRKQCSLLHKSQVLKTWQEVFHLSNRINTTFLSVDTNINLP